jgi:hypothetical protein
MRAVNSSLPQITANEEGPHLEAGEHHRVVFIGQEGQKKNRCWHWSFAEEKTKGGTRQQISLTNKWVLQSRPYWSKRPKNKV